MKYLWLLAAIIGCGDHIHNFDMSEGKEEAELEGFTLSCGFEGSFPNITFYCSNENYDCESQGKKLKCDVL